MPFLQTDKTYQFRGTQWHAVPGVYGIMNASKQMIYIGETEDFQRRMQEHQQDSAHCMHRYSPALVWAEVIQGGAEPRRQRERQLIAEYAPPCNG
ncbi:MAG: GIY-YIG nuclease family protein [Dehalococcoidia bacterium]